MKKYFFKLVDTVRCSLLLVLICCSAHVVNALQTVTLSSLSPGDEIYLSVKGTTGVLYAESTENQVPVIFTTNQAVILSVGDRAKWIVEKNSNGQLAFKNKASNYYLRRDGTNLRVGTYVPSDSFWDIITITGGNPGEGLRNAEKRGDWLRYDDYISPQNPSSGQNMGLYGVWTNRTPDYDRLTPLLAVKELEIDPVSDYQHVRGHSGAAMLENGMQRVHEYSQVVYIKPGETRQLRAHTSRSFYHYMRWYDYDTDKAVALVPGEGFDCDLWTDNDKCFGGVVKVTIDDPGENNWNLFPSYTAPGSAFGGRKIAVDQSLYTDFRISRNGSSITHVIEPTLSLRIIYDIRNASDMAAKMDGCANDGSFLEVHDIIAPTGRNLLIGPEYEFNGGNYPNYYCNEVSPTAMSNGTWRWNDNSLPEVFANQFFTVSRSTPGKETYTLTCQIDGKTYNVAQFNVTYMDASLVGPVQNMSNVDQRIEALTLLREQNFDYNAPETDNVTYYNVPLPYYESSYGFHYHDMQTSGQRHSVVPKGPYWSEYAFINRTDHGVKGQAEMYFTYPLSNRSGVRQGYFMYVDGSQKPGYLFNLSISEQLCPGDRMYFSAWVASVNNESSGVAPNLDFIIKGYDDRGNEYALTTYTTGEFGTGANTDTDPNARGKWLRVMFPITIDNAHEYTDFSLQILNKGRNNTGNDFAIDNIQIYASKPTLMAQQGVSNNDCYGPEGANIWTFLRVDYSSIEGNKLYYQWRDEATPLEADYLGEEENNNYGVITMPEKEITPSPVYTSFNTLDNYVKNNVTASNYIGYVKERNDQGEEIYVMYIGTKVNLQPGKTYEADISADLSTLGNGDCGMSTELQILGTTYISINGVKYDPSVEAHPNGVCGNRRYNMQVMLQATNSGDPDIPCRAAWLWGDEAWINLPVNQPNYYNTSYDDLCAAIRRYIRTDEANAEATDADKELVGKLIADKLFYLDRDPLDAYILANEANRQLSYTAFPYRDDNKGVCLNPLTAKVQVNAENLNVVRVGYFSEVIPSWVSVRPRVVRVSNAARERNAITIPVVYGGTEPIEFPELFKDTAGIHGPLTVSPYVIQPGTTEITLTGINQLETGKDYTFALRPTNFEVTNCETGEFYFTLRMIPDQVVWLRSSDGTWNKDGAYEPQFAPTPETDVILPAYNDGKGQMNDFTIPLPQADAVKQKVPLEEGARTYISYDINYEPYACRNIYVPDSTVILNQHLLQVNGQAYVDMTVPTNTWTLASMPITGVVSGDFWIPTGGNSLDPFTVPGISQVTGETATDRTAHEVWQSIYNGEAIQYGDYNRTVTSSNWSAPTNALNTPYGAGYGFALWAKSGDAQTTFRFPKPDTEYKFYYDYSGKWTDNQKVTVNRTGAGKFVYTGDTEITLRNMKESSYFLFGNPTMAYINLSALQAGNPGNLTGESVYLTPGETTSLDVNQTVDGLSTSGSQLNYLPPFGAVLLKATSPNIELTLSLKNDMLVGAFMPDPLRTRSSEEPSLMRIIAQTPNYVSRAVVAENLDASDWVLEGEDAELFLLDEYKTPFGIFTLADDKTLAINQINGALDIPLCLYVQSAEAVGNIKLTFTGSDSFLEQWSLYDVMTEQEVPLFNGCSYVLEMPNNGGVRYLLRRPSSDDGSSQPTDAFRVWSVGGDLTVYAGAGISNFRLTDMAGRLLHEERDYCQSVQLHLIPGVYLVYGEIAGKSYTQRVIVK